MPDLHTALCSFLAQNQDDKAIINLYQRIRALQSNGRQISQAITQACDIPDTQVRISTKGKHKDNAPAHLAIRHRPKILQYRSEGFGYGKIARLLAQRGAYNKSTGAAYSRSTIQRACYLLERKDSDREI